MKIYDKISLTNFTSAPKDKENFKDEKIFKYIQDKRILRVLFELKIFKLRETQKEAIQEGLFFRKSFLVCAPSGSGKTLIGEVCAVNIVFQKFGKSIYLMPFKALATEKYIHFKKSYERFWIHISEKLTFLSLMYNILKNRRNGNLSNFKGMQVSKSSDRYNINF